MQFNHDAWGFTLLAKPSIDTGMGLERVAAVLQGKISNYDTDLFKPLIDRAAACCPSFRYDVNPVDVPSFRIIADHPLAAAFLISDGVFPSNEGRGYVLRKIIRRAIRHGQLLGATKPFLSEMVRPVRDSMQPEYEELIQATPQINEGVFAQETRLLRTLEL